MQEITNLADLAVKGATGYLLIRAFFIPQPAQNDPEEQTPSTVKRQHGIIRSQKDEISSLHGQKRESERQSQKLGDQLQKKDETIQRQRRNIGSLQRQLKEAPARKSKR